MITPAARLASTLVTHKRALETREPMAAKHFFILNVHGPQRAVGHVAPSEPFLAERWDLEPQDT
jgi:hypothetical protein